MDFEIWSLSDNCDKSFHKTYWALFYSSEINWCYQNCNLVIWAATWQSQQTECAPIRPVWSESSLCAQWVAKDPSFLHADSEDSDQTGRMPRLIWVFAGRTVTLLVLSCRGSIIFSICCQFYLKECSRDALRARAVWTYLKRWIHT